MTIINVNRITAIRFYPNPHVVTDRVFQCDYYNEGWDIKRFYKSLLVEFNKQGVWAEHDNKVVFECFVEGRRIFYGFKDWTFSIGFGVQQLD